MSVSKTVVSDSSQQFQIFQILRIFPFEFRTSLASASVKRRVKGVSKKMALRIMVFLGSTRKAGPPRPVRVGDRVAKFIEESLKRRGHDIVRVVNPVEIQIPLLEKPHFAYQF